MPRRKRSAEESAALGNPGRRKLPVAPTSVLPPLDVMPPVDITEDAAKIWALLAPDLIGMNILRRTDALTFSIFCESFARYARALLSLQREGDVQVVKTVSGDKMRRVNPRLAVLREERSVVLRYAEKFGLTPVDRIRVITHLAGGAARTPDAPLPMPDRDIDVVDADQLDLDDAALPDQGPIGALN